MRKERKRADKRDTEKNERMEEKWEGGNKSGGKNKTLKVKNGFQRCEWREWQGIMGKIEREETEEISKQVKG